MYSKVKGVGMHGRLTLLQKTGTAISLKPVGCRLYCSLSPNVSWKYHECITWHFTFCETWKAFCVQTFDLSRYSMFYKYTVLSVLQRALLGRGANNSNLLYYIIVLLLHCTTGSLFLFAWYTCSHICAFWRDIFQDNVAIAWLNFLKLHSNLCLTDFHDL